MPNEKVIKKNSSILIYYNSTQSKTKKKSANQTTFKLSNRDEIQKHYVECKKPEAENTRCMTAFK